MTKRLPTILLAIIIILLIVFIIISAEKKCILSEQANEHSIILMSDAFFELENIVKRFTNEQDNPDIELLLYEIDSQIQVIYVLSSTFVPSDDFLYKGNVTLMKEFSKGLENYLSRENSITSFNNDELTQLKKNLSDFSNYLVSFDDNLHYTSNRKLYEFIRYVYTYDDYNFFLKSEIKDSMINYSKYYQSN